MKYLQLVQQCVINHWYCLSSVFPEIGGKFSQAALPVDGASPYPWGGKAKGIPPLAVSPARYNQPRASSRPGVKGINLKTRHDHEANRRGRVSRERAAAAPGSTMRRT
jgi:hypothetical protein